MTAAERDEKICVGVITSAHGVRGHVKVRSFTAYAPDFAAYGDLKDASGTHSYAVKIVGELKDQFLVGINGVNDRNAAEQLRGVKLYIERSRLPETAEDEFYYADLIGMAVETPQGETIGSVAAVYNFGAGDVLEVKRPDSSTEFVSFTRQTVPAVDVESRVLTVCMPETVEAKPGRSGSESRESVQKPGCEE